MGFWRYPKKAFLVPWNLLALAAGAAFGFLSGHPDVVLPIVAAGEVLYLAGLSANAKFRVSVDAQDNKRARTVEEKAAAERAMRILASLSPPDRQRFEQLRGLCADLRRIAAGVKDPDGPAGGIIDDLHAGGVNRLLWIYLKLLYSKSALERFFDTADEKEIEANLKRTKDRLDRMGPPEKDTDADAKCRKSLQDTLQTTEARLANYRKALQNYEYVQLELERLYTKIAGLGELAINRQDPDFISSEVDSVSQSVVQTEKAMGEMQFLTGLAPQGETAPPLLELDQA
jgi:chemotaxis protein histidine kinase CheA